MERKRLEILCIQKTKWKGDRARTMMKGYKLLQAGGDGSSNGVGIIVFEEISKTECQGVVTKDGGQARFQRQYAKRKKPGKK